MARKYYYLIDKVDTEKAQVLRKSLSIIPGVADVQVSLRQKLIEIAAKRDMTEQVKIACDVAGVQYRTPIKKSDLARYT